MIEQQVQNLPSLDFVSVAVEIVIVVVGMAY